MQPPDFETQPRPLYGLRNRNTGLVVRVETVDGGMYGPKPALTYDRGRPFWQTDDLQGLIMTAFEDRPRFNALPETPIWNGVDIRECDAIRFFEEAEYGPGGGDPVSVTHYIKTFDLEIYDLRDIRHQTADIMTVHYGGMQKVFRAYDMDKIDTMTLALVPVMQGEDASNMRGDVAVTESRGPCRIVEEAPLPEWWELNDVQKTLVEDGLELRLLLLDMAELGTWLDYDTIDYGPVPEADQVLPEVPHP